MDYIDNSEKTRKKILRDIVLERITQDDEWGPAHIQEKRWEQWVSILGEEYGEVCAVVNNPGDYWREDIRFELTQLAAVAVAMIESLEMGVEG